MRTLPLLLTLSACTVNHPPEIVGLTLFPAVIVPGDDVEALVEIADPEGADDLVAGWVEVGGAELARLEQGGVAGTFWAALPGQALAAQVATFEGEEVLGVRVFVTDTEGNEASAARRLTLTCGEESAWCGSRCAELEDDPDHCGECGHTCGPYQRCEGGTCVGGPGWSDCEQQDTRVIDCASRCGASGLVCGNGCDDGVLADHWARYAASAPACRGEAGTSNALQWEPGENCVATAGSEPPIWVSCCCVAP